MKTINLRSFKNVSQRRTTLEKELKLSLPNIASYYKDEEVASSRNCENMIGITQVPLGIAGPLKTSHVSPLGKTRGRQSTAHNYFIPLAITEGALVASVSRG